MALYATELVDTHARTCTDTARRALTRVCAILNSSVCSIAVSVVDLATGPLHALTTVAPTVVTAVTE